MNVVLICTDQQRRDSLGCYGNPVTETPNLDAFARESLRFNRAYVANPICMPNRVSMFTGCYPGITACGQTGCYWNTACHFYPGCFLRPDTLPGRSASSTLCLLVAVTTDGSRWNDGSVSEPSSTGTVRTVALTM